STRRKAVNLPAAAQTSSLKVLRDQKPEYPIMQKRIAAHTTILFKYQFFILIFSAYLCLSVLFSRDHDHCACRKCKYKREERRCFVS
ncbi:hypothetical protein, partial [Agathobacter rectalis]|uniref:hypothetical protein n=1 Tax=Agathobacter rectalis TaxID=39491 RepID=UPI0027D2CF11